MHVVIEFLEQVQERLQRLNLTMSNSATHLLLEKVGSGHDEQVKQWQHVLVTSTMYIT